MRRILTVLAAALVAGFTLGTPASATNTTEHEPVCSTWKARGATGQYPNVQFGGQPAGTEISKNSAKLTKPASGTAPGVEFASFDLGVGPMAQEAHVMVSYSTSGGASASAGAIRMFGYDSKNADTLNDAPDWQATAESEAGNLLFTVPAGKKIGTLGLVFDASNNTTGAVTFTNLKVGERPVSFTECPKPEPTSSSSSATPKPSTSASSSGTPKPSSSSPRCSQYDTKAEAQAAYLKDPVGLAALDEDQDGRACEWTPSDSAGGLPVTGPSMGVLISLAIAVVGAGVLLTMAVRRRKMKFVS